eukprot:1196288-Prorocentrum_minimum.AAC.2
MSAKSLSSSDPRTPNSSKTKAALEQPAPPSGTIVRVSPRGITKISNRTKGRVRGRTPRIRATEHTRMQVGGLADENVSLISHKAVVERPTCVDATQSLANTRTRAALSK